jgi:hypothetical protein
MYPVYPYYGYDTRCEKIPLSFPPQRQGRLLGFESEMTPQTILLYWVSPSPGFQDAEIEESLGRSDD